MESVDCPLNHHEIEAVMLDELFMGGTEFRHAYDRLFEPWQIAFADSVQETVFLNYLEALWEDLQAVYDRTADHQRGRIRHELLQFNDHRLHWLADFKVGNRSVPAPAQACFEEIAGISLRITELLRLLGGEHTLESPDQADELLEAAVDIGTMQGKLIDQYEKLAR